LPTHSFSRSFSAPIDNLHLKLIYLNFSFLRLLDLKLLPWPS